MLVHIALALQLKADPSLQPRLEGVPVATNAITDAAGYAVLNFLTSWRTAWEGSVDWRGSNSTDWRLRDDHCHWDGTYSAVGGRGYNRPPTLIHRDSRRSMCPNWFPTDEQMPSDESRLLDASLTPDWIATYAVPLLTDPARLHAMGAAAAHLIPLDADEKLARMILGAAGGP